MDLVTINWWPDELIYAQPSSGKKILASSVYLVTIQYETNCVVEYYTIYMMSVHIPNSSVQFFSVKIFPALPVFFFANHLSSESFLHANRGIQLLVS
jgi:sensor histidine kinase YesM